MRIRRAHVFVAGLLAMACACSARPSDASWSADTTLSDPVCIHPGDAIDPIVVEDGAGGFITMWMDFRRPGFDPDLYCRRVTAGGDTLWGANGTPICDVVGSVQNPTMIADGQGGAFVGWFDFRSTAGYYVQHVRPNGSVAWAANGIRPVNGFNSSRPLRLCLDGAGGVFMAFSTSSALQIQRLDSLGVKRISVFPPAEGAVIGPGNSTPWQLLADGAGGAIAIFTPTGTSDLYAQRIDPTGALQWLAGGVSLSSSPNTEGAAGATTDDAGGAIIAWADSRNGDSDIFAQRVSASGALQWGAAALAICVMPGTQDRAALRRVSDGGAIVAWMDDRVGTRTSLFAQRLASDGAIAWAPNGATVASGSSFLTEFAVIPGDGDTTIVAWNSSPGMPGDVFAQAIDPNGQRLWGEYGASVCHGPSAQHDVAAVSDGQGGVFAVFRDFRSGNGDIAAAHLNRSGLKGESAVEVPRPGGRGAWVESIQPAPNPGRGEQRLAFSEPLRGLAMLEILDARGRSRLRLALAAGTRSWLWDGRDHRGLRVEPGVYWALVRGGSRVATGRITRVE